MTITIRIEPTAFNSGGPLESFATTSVLPYANPLQYPEVPLPIGTPEGATGAPGPGFIASASPLTFRSNIREDGTFPTPPVTSMSYRHHIIVHVSPTSGSTIIRGDRFNPARAEFDPSYGLNVGVSAVMMEDSVFETAIKEASGFAFRANLQELVALGIIEVAHDGTVLDETDIRDFTA